jgi:hypothetical protein
MTHHVGLLLSNTALRKAHLVISSTGASTLDGADGYKNAIKTLGRGTVRSLAANGCIGRDGHPICHRQYVAIPDTVRHGCDYRRVVDN